MSYTVTLSTIDDRQATALRSIRNSTAGETLESYIQSQINELRQRNDSELDMTMVRTRQGAIQFAVELLRAFDRAQKFVRNAPPLPAQIG